MTKYRIVKVGRDFTDTDYVEKDLSTVPLHMRGDFQTRNENVQKLRALCERCNGTGNELFSMYKQCSDCQGKGYKKETI